MSHITRLAVVFAAALAPIACTTTPTEQPTGARPEIIFDDIGGIWQPAMGVEKGARPVIPDGQRYRATGPFDIDMRDVPRAERATANLQGLEQRRGGGRIESQLPDDVANKLRDDARFLRPSPFIQDVSEGAVFAPSQAPAAAGTGFDSIDYNQCCGGGGNVPPDPELAAGPNHVIAVVNVAFEIYNTSGASQGGVRTFASLFSGVPGCTGVFDPNANYDEAEDRFILGIDGDGGSYCIAVSASSDPTGSWYRYSFQTASRKDFFDYPHAGVGDDAIYLGANIFGPRTFKEGRVWAIDKFAMYTGSAPTVVSFGIGSDGTPQPMNLHGFNQGTWPAAGEPHYILTDGQSFTGASYGVWSWNNPFGGGAPVKKSKEVNLNSATGPTAGMPVDAPQAGGGKLQANDFRGQDAEYRNGHIWMSNAQSCNPGSGTVNCVRWAEIDPVGPSVVNAGVIGTNGQYRSFPDLAVDNCGNMMLGYSKTSSSSNPGVFAVGRDSSGAMQQELTVKSTQVVYTAFDGAPYRWGDYTEMTVAPDGATFWYLGEYSKNTNNNNGKWGTWIQSFSFGCGGGTANSPPHAVITSVQCNNSTKVCSFSASGSSDSDGTITNYAWNFGDNTAGGGVTASHTYAAYGSYTVSLTVTDDANDTDSAQQTVTLTNPVDPVKMSVANLVLDTQNLNGGNKAPRATVTILDDQGNPVGAVLVKGTFTGDGAGNGNDTTDGSGLARVVSSGSKKGKVNFTFCVTEVSGGSLTWDGAKPCASN